MASEGTSTSSDKERMEACESAVNILAQGKRNMVCGEIPTAVNQFQEACTILSKAYGETAKECADAYFCYGQALLDLARMENGVLGNALQGVPDTDDETTEQKDEQFEKADIAEPEREKLRKEVYDAMGEKEEEIKERKIKEAEKNPENGETVEVSMETDDKAEKKDAKDEKKDAKDEKKDAKAEKKDDKAEKKDDKAEKKDDKDEKKDDKSEKAKRDKDETKDGKKTKDEKSDKKDDISEKPDEKAEAKDKPKSEEKKSEDVEMKGAKKEDEEGSADGDEEEGEGTEEEGTEEEGEAAEGEGTAEGEGAAEEGEDTASQEGSQDGENADDVSNLQLAWEMLELAKLIYSKDESKEARLRSAESHLKLGEVSLETEQYEEAVKDLNKCLELQKQLLEPDNRLLAETHYQLGLAYCFNKQFKESTDSYQAAIKVIEERVANLDKILEKATEEEKETKDFDSPVYKAKKEVTELKELVPDIKAKIEDVDDEKKNMDDLKNLAKEALGGLSSSSAGPAESTSAPPKEDKKASDISHLIKRKRKSEEPEAETVKKAKQEDGSGDAKVNEDAKVNGTAEKESEPEPMEAKS